jgi:superfamily II DNA/RNA helicase
MKTSQKKVGAASLLCWPRASFVNTSVGGKESEENFETNWDLEVNKFDDMGLKEEVLRGIYGYGFKDPSPIQQKAILPIIQGKDTIA